MKRLEQPDEIGGRKMPASLFATASVTEPKENTGTPSDIVKGERIARAGAVREIIGLDGSDAQSVIHDNIQPAAAGNHQARFMKVRRVADIRSRPASTH